MDKISNKAKWFIVVFSLITVVVILMGVFYLRVLPNLVSSERVISYIEKAVEKHYNIKLEIKKPAKIRCIIERQKK